jgi:TolB-like protein
MESVAEAGEICISGTVYDAIENKIGLEYEYMGEQEVKNIDKPVRAYRVLSFPGAAAHRVIRAKKTVERTWRKTTFAIAAVLVIAVGAYAIWNYTFRAAPPSKEVVSEKPTSTELSEKPSIAVLPFVNMSDDPKQEYFSDGMSEDVITDLSKIPGLLVISRNTSFTYRGKSVKTQQIAKELGVRYVLEGSVRKADNRVRINAQLIDSTTGHHLWAERYDGNISDIFALQDKITQKIVTSLAVKLTEDEKNFSPKKRRITLKLPTLS